MPERGFLTKAERWLYPGGHPNDLARLLNRGWAIVHGTGLLPRRYVTLQVPRRPAGGVPEGRSPDPRLSRANRLSP